MFILILMPTGQESLSSSLDPFDPKKILDPKTTSLDKQDISGLEEALSSTDKTQKLFKEIKKLMGNQIGSFRNRMDHLMYQYISWLTDWGEKTKALQTYVSFLNQGKSEFSNNTDWDDTFAIDVTQMENYLRQRSERYNIIYVPIYKKRWSEYQNVEAKNYRTNISNLKLKEQQEEYEMAVRRAIDLKRWVTTTDYETNPEGVSYSASEENKKELVDAAIRWDKIKTVSMKKSNGKTIDVTYTIYRWSLLDALKSFDIESYNNLLHKYKADKIKKDLYDNIESSYLVDPNKMIRIFENREEEGLQKIVFIRKRPDGFMELSTTLIPTKKPTWIMLPLQSLPAFTAPEFAFRPEIKPLIWVDMKIIEPKDIMVDAREQLHTLQDQIKKQGGKEEEKLNQLFDYGQKKIFHQDSPRFLNDEIRRNLDEVAEYLRSHPDKKILIVGYHGNGKHEIAQKRAQAVKQYLVKQWIDEKRISAEKSRNRIAQSISIKVL